MMTYKTIGLIGGMGPLATVDLFQKIVQMTRAEKDQEHIPILIDNNTNISDSTDYLLGKGSSPLDELIFSASRLQKLGADFLIIACNTAHYFYADISSVIKIPIVNMIEETAKEALYSGYKKVGLLGTEGFMSCVNYMSYYNDVGIELVLPSKAEQDIITALIYKAIKAQNDDFDISAFLLLLEKLSKEGAEAFVLSCTELPIAFSKYRIAYPSIDPTTVLARKAIITAGGEIK